MTIQRLDRPKPMVFVLDERASEALDQVLDEDVEIYLSFQYSGGDSPSDGGSGPPVSDPLTIDLHFPSLGGSALHGPKWRTTIDCLIDDALEWDRSEQILRPMLERMRALADRIEHAIENGDDDEGSD